MSYLVRKNIFMEEEEAYEENEFQNNQYGELNYLRRVTVERSKTAHKEANRRNAENMADAKVEREWAEKQKQKKAAEIQALRLKEAAERQMLDKRKPKPVDAEVPDDWDDDLHSKQICLICQDDEHHGGQLLVQLSCCDRAWHQSCVVKLAQHRKPTCPICRIAFIPA